MTFEFNNVITEILNDCKDKSYYENKYPEFFLQCPILSNNIFKPNFDKNMLQFMLKQKLQIEKNEVSEHDASVNVGSRLVDTYIKPIIE